MTRNCRTQLLVRRKVKPAALRASPKRKIKRAAILILADEPANDEAVSRLAVRRSFVECLSPDLEEG